MQSLLDEAIDEVDGRHAIAYQIKTLLQADLHYLLQCANLNWQQNGLAGIVHRYE